MRFFVSIILLTFTESQRDKMDTKRCKVTHNGIEYEGRISQTESGLLCKHWMLDSSIRESDFIDGNKSLKTNHCRNVRAKFENPWCYTTDPNVAEEICDVRLCNSNCRGTGAGNEYGGDLNETYSGRDCLMWSEKIYRKYLNKKHIMTSERALLDRKFPEMSRKKARNFCRNPTGDPKGPWCLVEDLFESKVQYEKEYCDVTFCEETNCTFGTNGFYGDDYHTHFFSLRNKTTISLDLQLWNVDLSNYSFRISFNSHPLPLSGENLLATRNGIEVLITNEGFGYVTPVDEDDDGEQHKSEDWYSQSRVISGVTRRNIEVSWLPEFSQISTKISGFKSLKKLYGGDDDQNSTILGLRNGSLVYTSISGNGGLWNLPCDGVFKIKS